MLLGLDISTSITGATILDEDGKVILCEAWDTRNKNHFPTLYHKADFIIKKIKKLDSRFKIGYIYIEQSLQSFRRGFSSARTLSILSRFNGIISWACWDIFGIEPQMLSATSARKTVGVPIRRGDNAKEKVLQFLLDNEPEFVIMYTKYGNPKPESYDKADSIIIARAGYECIKKNLPS
jgi:hypothetical protein